MDREGQTDKKKLGFGQFGWFDQVYFGLGKAEDLVKFSLFDFRPRWM